MKRDTFLPSITTLLIFGMAVFLSCAHQNRVRDGIDEEAAAAEEQAAVTEEGSVAPPEGDQPQGELADLTQEPPAEGTPTDQQPVADASAPTDGSTPPTGAEDADLKELGIDSNTPPADTAAATQNPETQAMGDGTAGAVTTDPNAAAVTPGGAAAESSLDPLTGLEAGTGAAAVAGADSSQTTTTEAVPPTETTTSNSPGITRMEPIIDSGAGSRGSVEPSTGGTWSGTSSVPKIPSSAINRHGITLNRFYMARVGDTPDSAAKLFYGSEDHAADLKKWNGRNWQPGKVIFYKSAIEPNDPTMRSFYQEKGVQPEEYTIQKGDWLSKVAKRQLGHPRSWKEIAVINGMSSPDSIEVGQKIAIYPKELADYSSKPVAEEPPREEPQPIAKIPEPVQPQQQQPQQIQNQPTDPNAELAKQMPQEPPPMQEPPKVSKPQAVDPSKVVEQNLPAVFILGGVLILSALYLIVRRKKSQRPLDDFGDENFAPPTKLKRK